MVTIIALKTIISSMETEISGMTLKRETNFTRGNTATFYANYKNSCIKMGYKINNRPRIQQSSVNDDAHVIVEQNQQLQERVQRIKEMMASKSRECNHVEELVMIDAIQRLGLQYYFRNEISEALRRHYERYGVKERDHDLHDAALRFHLLRQQGYNVSADCYRKFKDNNGIFKHELGKDIKGLLSLFEASHMRIPEDHILDGAGEFSGYFLGKMKNIEPSQEFIIGNTLSNPFHKSLPRFMALNFLPNFQIAMKLLHNLSDESEWIKEMQYLAEIDINMSLTNYHNEITQVLRWWKGLRLTEELKLARQQPAKWHMWSLACLPGPNMADQRLELTKAISFVYIIDDIFDVYGSLEELTLFTEAVNRWEYANVTGLPNYMRVCLKSLYEVINEISDKTYDKHGWNPKEFLQRAWKDLCNAFLVEAKWFASGHTPSTDVYLKNGKISCGVGIVCAYLFLLLGEGGNDRSQDLFNGYPNIALGATIFRLWDDLGSAKDENQNGHDGSYVACYMNEYEGSSIESAREHVHTMISDAWECLNEACLSPSPFSADFKEGILNLARMVPFMFNYDGSHSLPSLEKHKKSFQFSN